MSSTRVSNSAPARSRAGPIAALFVAALASFGGLGDLDLPLRRLLLLGGLACVLITPWRRRELLPGDGWRLLTVLLGAVASVCVMQDGEALALTWTASGTAWLLARARRPAAAEFQAYACAAATTTLIWVLVSRVEPLWQATTSACLALSVWMSELVIGKALELGPTYCGIQLIVFLAALGLWRSHGLRDAVVRLASGPAPIILSTPAAYSFTAWLDRLGSPAHLHRNELLDLDVGLRRFTDLGSWMFPSNTLLLLGAIALLLELTIARRLRSTPSAAAQTRPGRVAWFPVVVLVTGTLLSAWSVRRPALDPIDGARVVIHDPGGGLLEPLQDAIVPAPGVSFAALVPRLEALGFVVRRVTQTELPPEELESARVVVVINVPGPYSEAMRERILGFVERGGSLLCLTDHTGTTALRDPINQLAAAGGIEVNFDSARGVGLWSESVLRFHPYVREGSAPGPRRFDALGIGTGASLTVRSPARVVLTGRRFFSDPGDLQAHDRGFVANLNPDLGERLGDLPLVAETHRGSGRIMVFGDTSSFQTTMLPATFGFVARVFTYLAGPPKPREVFSWTTISLLILSAVLMSFGARRGSALAPAWIAACCLLLDRADALELARHDPAARASVGLGGRVAHWLVGPSSGSPAFGPHGLEGLFQALERRGFVTVATLGGLDRSPPGLAILIDPKLSLGESDARDLLDFVARGGQALVTFGYENRGALAPLFDKLEVEIPYKPLGPFRTRTRLERNGQLVEAEFLSAWPIDVRSRRDADPIATPWGHCVVAAIPWGSGEFVLVADARFFSSANLEGISSFNPRNLEFTCALLERMQRRL